MKTPTAFIVVFSFVITCAAQITFQKSIGVYGYQNASDVHQTSDGGYIASVQVQLPLQDVSTGLIKFNVNGDTLWTKTYLKIGGTYTGPSYSAKYFCEQTFDEGFILSGVDSAGDVYLIKTDSLGNLVWAKSFGGPGADVGCNVQQTTDSGYIFTGYTDSYGPGDLDLLLVKTDALGDTLWTRVFGGGADDVGQFVQQTNDGGYIVVGYTKSFSSPFDVYIIKTDYAGDTLWTRTLGWVNDDQAFMVRQTADGNYIILISYPGLILAKIDITGNLLWAKYGALEMACSFKETNDLGFIIVGYGLYNDRDIHLVKTDINGNVLWDRNYGGSQYEFGSGVDLTTDGGYIFGGFNSSFTPPMSADMYFVKTDSLGNSGCFDNIDTLTMVTYGNYQVFHVPTIVGHANFTIGTPTITIGHIDSVTTLCSSVGIQEPLPEKTFLISPNPAASAITIHLPDDSKNFVVEIYSSLGMKMRVESISLTDPDGSGLPRLRQAYGDRSLSVDCRRFARGFYFVKVQSEKYREVQKLIIQ